MAHSFSKYGAVVKGRRDKGRWTKGRPTKGRQGYQMRQKADHDKRPTGQANNTKGRARQKADRASTEKWSTTSQNFGSL